MNIIDKGVDFDTFFRLFSRFEFFGFNSDFGQVFFDYKSREDVYKIYKSIEKHFSDLKYDMDRVSVLNKYGKMALSKYIEMFCDYDFLISLSFNSRDTHFMFKVIFIVVSLYFGHKISIFNSELSRRASLVGTIFELRFPSIKKIVDDMRISRVSSIGNDDMTIFTRLSFRDPYNIRWI